MDIWHPIRQGSCKMILCLIGLLDRAFLHPKAAVYVKDKLSEVVRSILYIHGRLWISFKQQSMIFFSHKCYKKAWPQHPLLPATRCRFLNHSMPCRPHHSDAKNHSLYSRILPHHSVPEIRVQILPGLGNSFYSPFLSVAWHLLPFSYCLDFCIKILDLLYTIFCISFFKPI